MTKPTEGWRQVDDEELNSTASFLLSTELLVGQEQTESGAQMEVQFYLFAADDDGKKSIDLGRNVTLSVKPSLAKFSLRFTGKWPFSSSAAAAGEGGADKNGETWLEMRIKVSPPFTRSTRTHDEEDGVTRFVLEGQYANSEGQEAKGSIRLVDAVEVDGETVVDGQDVQFEMDVETSELVLRFARFNSSLTYDPGTTPDESLSSAFLMCLITIGACDDNGVRSGSAVWA